MRVVKQAPRPDRIAFLLLALGLCLGCGTADEPEGPGEVDSTGSVVRPTVLPAGDGSFVETGDGTRLHYEVVGSGSQVVIVPMHFLLRDAFSARPELLEGRTLVFYDPRNRGRSDALNDLSSLSLYSDLADLELVRREVGAERVSLIGFSYLGKMAVMYAMKYPERVERVVQLGPVSRDPEKIYPPHLSATDRLQAMGPEAVAELQRLQIEGAHRTAPQEFCRQEWAVTRRALVGDPARASLLPEPCDLEREWPVNLQSHFQSLFVANQQIEPPLETVTALETPVLVIHGTRDRHAPYGAGRSWAYALPNARLLTVEGGAHCSWIDAPEAVFRAMARFLDGGWPKGVEDVERPDPRVDPDAEV